jgi:hypothetical protein
MMVLPSFHFGRSHSSTTTSWKSALCSPGCSPKCTGPSLRKRRPLYWEADPVLLTLDVRRWMGAVLAAESVEEVAVAVAVAGLAFCCFGYESDTAGARERKPPTGVVVLGDEDILIFNDVVFVFGGDRTRMAVWKKAWIEFARKKWFGSAGVKNGASRPLLFVSGGFFLFFGDGGESRLGGGMEEKYDRADIVCIVRARDRAKDGQYLSQ